MVRNWDDIDSIIAENQQRLDEINKPYDPIVGTEYTDVIPRYHVHIPDAPIPDMWLPVEMKQSICMQVIEKAGWTLARAGAAEFGGAQTAKKSLEMWRWFCKERCKYDGEFFFATEIKIEHKILLTMVPFVLNRAQRYYFAKLEKLRKANKPIFIILLKARQWGGSTLTQFYMIWLQLFHYKNWHSIIAADTDEHAMGVQAMFQRAIEEEFDTFVTDGEAIHFKPYKNMKGTRVISRRGARVSIGSVQHPEFIRSQNVTMAHLTEVGIWPTTPKHDPQSLVQSLSGTIQRKPGRLKVLESTAKGVGNYFHRTWLKANLKGRQKNEYTPVFVPWYMIDFYQKKVTDYAKFIITLSPYEKTLFGYGATLEAIAYYRDLAEGEFGDDPKGLKNEFPSTPDEAFQSSGNNFYPDEYVERLRQGVRPPKIIGEIVGAERMGKQALEDLRIVPQSNGCLKIWKDRDSRPPMKNRYLVVVDIGGHSKTADNSVICVFDRYWMHNMGVPEVVAEWCGHIEWDLLAWKAAQLGMYYGADDGGALLVVESNTLETKGSEGNHFNTLLSTIAEDYPNMYCRTPAEQLVDGAKLHYGFQTNHSTKPMVCDYQLMVLREDMYIEHCAEAVDEHRTFEVKQNGELGAVEGNRDDRHITRAIGNYFNYKIMPFPVFIIDDMKNRTATSESPVAGISSSD